MNYSYTPFVNSPTSTKEEVKRLKELDSTLDRVRGEISDLMELSNKELEKEMKELATKNALLSSENMHLTSQAFLMEGATADGISDLRQEGTEKFVAGVMLGSLIGALVVIFMPGG